MRPLSDFTRHSQLRLGAALRARVAGDDAAERAQVIWGREGERWFTPEDPVWRVHADAAMFPGGVAALLLQSLHPPAMASGCAASTSGSVGATRRGGRTAPATRVCCAGCTWPRPTAASPRTSGTPSSR